MTIEKSLLAKATQSGKQAELATQQSFFAKLQSVPTSSSSSYRGVLFYQSSQGTSATATQRELQNNTMGFTNSPAE